MSNGESSPRVAGNSASTSPPSHSSTPANLHVIYLSAPQAPAGHQVHEPPTALPPRSAPVSTAVCIPPNPTPLYYPPTSRTGAAYINSPVHDHRPLPHSPHPQPVPPLHSPHHQPVAPSPLVYPTAAPLPGHFPASHDFSVEQHLAQPLLTPLYHTMAPRPPAPPAYPVYYPYATSPAQKATPPFIYPGYAYHSAHYGLHYGPPFPGAQGQQVVTWPQHNTTHPKTACPNPCCKPSEDPSSSASQPAPVCEKKCCAARSSAPSKPPHRRIGNIPNELSPVISKGDTHRRRLQWTDRLHRKFLAALDEIGPDIAVPKSIMIAMNVPGLTRENIASHLQKYRKSIRKGQAACVETNDEQGRKNEENRTARAGRKQG